MDLLSRVLAPRSRLIVRVITSLFTLGVCTAIAYGGYRLRRGMLDEKDFHLIRPADGVLALPIASWLIAVHVALHVFLDGIHLARGTLPAATGPSAH
jgi:TRAP-type C4-dicarboxylate transport system permease small subunit